MLRRLRGQSTLEYALVIAAVIGALIAMQIYLKRGMSGRIKASTEDIGEQFDPTAYTASITTTNKGTSRESVVNKVTKSEVVAADTTNKTGSETLTAWTAGESVYKGQ